MQFPRTYTWLKRVLYAILLLVLILCGGLVSWVVTGPRSLERITPYIASALAPADGSYTVHIGASLLLWDGIENPIGLHVKDIEVVNNKGAVIASFPELRVHLFVGKLLMGKIDIRTLEIEHPNALLIEQDDGTLSFGFVTAAENNADAASSPMAGALAMLVSDDQEQPAQHLKSLIIRHATVSVKKLHGGIFLQSSDASLVITRAQGSAHAMLTMPLQFGDKHGEFETEFNVSGKDKTVTAETLYTDIPFTLLHDLIPTQPLFEGVKLTVSGWTHGVSDFDGTIHSIDFMADAGAGTIELPKHFAQPLMPVHIHAEGTVSDKLTTCTLTKAKVDFKDFTITAKGTVHKEGEHYAVDGHAETTQASVDVLPHYWPVTLAPHTRTWVTSHITKGSVPQASVDLHFKAGELELKDTPEQAVTALVVLHNAEVRYLPQHPAVTQVDAVVNFTGKSMVAHITRAHDFSDTQVTSGSLSFPDLNADNVRLFLDVNLAGPVKDVVDFLSLPDVNKAKTLHLDEHASGAVEGNVKLNFIAFSDDDKPDAKAKEALGSINYAVDATTHDATLPHLLGKYDLTAANLKLSLDNKGIKASGDTNINTLPMKITLSDGFAKPHNTTYTIKADMPVARLKDFGHEPPDFLHGTMGVDATFVSSDNEDHQHIKLDLTRAAIELPENGFEKPVSEEATAEFVVTPLPSGETDISDFTLKGPKLMVSGKAQLAKDGTLMSAELSQLQAIGNDLDSVEYTRIPGGMKLSAKGKTVNLAPYMNSKDDNTKTMILDIDVNEAVFGKDRALTDVSAEADCASICRTIHVKAHLKDSTKITYDIADGKVNATSENAGELLRVLGIYDEIRSGKLTLTGTYTGERITGTLSVTNYTLEKAPILTKMITIASLTGIFDTVTGKGIAFAHLTAPFEYEHHKILLKDAKAHGAALGITASGMIDTQASTLNLEGTLIPSYTLNSLAGNIPLIGKLLTGGSEKGIIALNYSIKGNSADPSISINPLSVFTPGFMRGIFDIFDESPPDLDKIKSDQKPAPSPAASSIP